MYVIDTHCVASVHLPRIGHSTPHFNWYGTERLIRKHLIMRKIPTFMYPLGSKGIVSGLPLLLIKMYYTLN